MALCTIETFLITVTRSRIVNEPIPVVQHLIGAAQGRAPRTTMTNSWAAKNVVFGAASMVILASLVSLTGCQGVSASSSSGSGGGNAGQLSVSPGTIAVGNVADGSSGTATGTLMASGASVVVSAVSSNNSAFTVSGLSLPQTIGAGSSASFTVTFSPTAAGAQTATLTFSSNAETATTNAVLTGTGTATSAHSVSLSWNASPSSNILGYNVYRAAYSSNACGSYAKINSLLNTTTLYTDSSVVNGGSYCYASTAVNTSSEESAYSNVVSDVQIPAN